MEGRNSLRKTLVRNGSAVPLGTVFVTLCMVIVPLSSFLVSGMTPRDDTTPPVTTISFQGKAGDNGWYVSSVNVTLNASDAESGVNATYYTINNGSWILYANGFQVSVSGNYSIAFYSTDKAGNVEPQHTQPLNIDTIAPWIINLKHISFNEIAFAASVQDDISGVNRVEFYLYSYENPNGTLEKTDTSPLYCWVFHNYRRHMNESLWERQFVYDNAGNGAGAEGPIPGDIKQIIGFVCDPIITNTSLTFRAVLTMYNPSGLLPPLLLPPLKYTITNYDGDVRPHWIDIYFI